MSNDGRWFAVRTMPYRTQDNRIDGVVIVFSDITVAKNASDELFDSRQILLKIIDSIPQRVYWKGRDSVYLGCNQAFAKDCGYEGVDDLIGKTDDQMALPNHYTADDCLVMESGRSMLKLEEALADSEGTRIWLNSNKVPLMDKTGRVAGMLGTYEDISERKRLEENARVLGLSSLQERFDTQSEQLQQAKGKLQEKNG
ncbi:PAS domain-containing protein [Alkalimarinus alittae]|uniref:PAS domain-containing protein n=1 Tax=Alkalimarinus alittae TaxID=2961619 RepID=A0ABY6N2H6_9ALTE|nr:PAS domain-containing protein [Alkalimarinus alittae]UZE96202.1 PAS domain-containing protein [Alkalimarinus alittae]